ncbi:unnamed protein product [Acanthoscelides obtectus]|uniref:Uncharacterized protein n=1 Tax=Acanthoscelides obtectus TaxID=200917 RepID=A0A9P0M5F3_ACAOB|nr:unnamed protein product [Acanthoscelides obtectus]CAK1677681.1 hypothetical protein AOBTE_LOCUS31484 [Acanthoscelides obtectus]
MILSVLLARTMGQGRLELLYLKQCLELRPELRLNHNLQDVR